MPSWAGQVATFQLTRSGAAVPGFDHRRTPDHGAGPGSADHRRRLVQQLPAGERERHAGPGRRHPDRAVLGRHPVDRRAGHGRHPGPAIVNQEFPDEVSEEAQGIRFIYTSALPEPDGFPPPLRRGASDAAYLRDRIPPPADLASSAAIPAVQPTSPGRFGGSSPGARPPNLACTPVLSRTARRCLHAATGVVRRGNTKGTNGFVSALQALSWSLQTAAPLAGRRRPAEVHRDMRC